MSVRNSYLFSGLMHASLLILFFLVAQMPRPTPLPFRRYQPVRLVTSPKPQALAGKTINPKPTIKSSRSNPPRTIKKGLGRAKPNTQAQSPPPVNSRQIRIPESNGHPELPTADHLSAQDLKIPESKVNLSPPELGSSRIMDIPAVSAQPGEGHVPIAPGDLTVPDPMTRPSEQGPGVTGLRSQDVSGLPGIKDQPLSGGNVGTTRSAPRSSDLLIPGSGGIAEAGGHAESSEESSGRRKPATFAFDWSELAGQRDLNSLIPDADPLKGVKTEALLERIRRMVLQVKRNVDYTGTELGLPAITIVSLRPGEVTVLFQDRVAYYVNTDSKAGEDFKVGPVSRSKRDRELETYQEEARRFYAVLQKLDQMGKLQ